ncbi:MAG: cytochrome c [Pseudomonadota bacterium]
MSKRLLLSAIILLATAVTAHAESLYAPCKACHLADGRGVPGAFPPLREQVVSFASTPEGRTYLTLILKRGGIGRIQVGGKTYMGAMPAQSRLSDEKIAKLLNYVVTDIAGAKNAKPFTAEEVGASLAAHPEARGKKVVAMRPDPNAKPAPKAETQPEAPEKPEKEALAPMTEDDKRWAAHLKTRAGKS